MAARLVFQADDIRIRELEFDFTGQDGQVSEQLFVILLQPRTLPRGRYPGNTGLAAATGLSGWGFRLSASGVLARVDCSGFFLLSRVSFHPLPFAVISVRSGEQEVAGATRSDEPFWILLMPRLTARAGHRD